MFNFPGFGGFPGFPGGGPDDDDEMGEENKKDQNDKEIDNKKLYEILQVDSKASDEEIKKSFRKLALVLHPDKPTGDPEKFKELQAAYEILKDPKKRETYDKYGLEGLEAGGGMPSGFDDILGHLFGMGHHKQQGPKKAKARGYEMNVTLEDVYVGVTKKKAVKRSRVCVKCSGLGGEGAKKCTKCGANGIINKMMQLGPGMFQQVRIKCPDCNGEGSIIPEGKTCTDCKGQKIIIQEKDLDVVIETGAPNHLEIPFHGEGDEYPDVMAGDIVVRLMLDEHPVFQRAGADLIMKKNILLIEALTGTKFEVTHLDHTKFIVTTHNDDIIKPGDKKVVVGKGMPFFGDRMSHGNLIIEFTVVFPENQQIKKHFETLAKILPHPQNVPTINKNSVVLTMDEFDKSCLNPDPSGGRRGEADHDDEEEGGHRVQCNQQ